MLQRIGLANSATVGESAIHVNIKYRHKSSEACPVIKFSNGKSRFSLF